MSPIRPYSRSVSAGVIRKSLCLAWTSISIERAIYGQLIYSL